MQIELKRVYEPPDSADGVRILVERLWPRGLTKAAAAIDHWTKEVAPTPALRKWYGHRPELWPEFRQRYLAELTENTAEVDALKRLCADGPVTFVYAAKDMERNSATVLRAFLLEET
ncbi:MAG: DUF488 family protein [Alphaproteobacteria bacterium]|nr:DUF488 family protein [Alphaproteobacteria bacterium]